MNNFFLILFTTVCGISFSQINYDDVAVIINTNSTESIEIGEYFQSQRNIPEGNMIRVQSSDSEVVDSLDFISLIETIRDSIESKNLTDEINYIVTTKGVPLRNNLEGVDIKYFDAVLSLILGSHEPYIYNDGTIQNPYLNANTHFSRNEFDIYIVSRLSGHSVSDVKNLIDRSGPNTAYSKNNCLAVNDAGGGNATEMALFNSIMSESVLYLDTNSWNYIYNSDSTYEHTHDSVLFYYMLGRYTEEITLDFTWAKGSFALLGSVNTGSTFEDTATLTYPNLATLISDGLCGGLGFGITYVSYIPDFDVFLKSFTDSDNPYNMGESAFQSIKRIPTQTTLTGDPKTSIIQNSTSVYNPVSPKHSIFPNPAKDQLNIDTNHPFSYTITDVAGKIVKTDKTNSIHQYINLQNLKKGVYFIKIIADEMQSSYKFIKL